LNEPKHHDGFALEPLEQRLLLSASLAPVDAAFALGDAATPVLTETLSEADPSPSDTSAAGLFDFSATPDALDLEDQSTDTSAETDAAADVERIESSRSEPELTTVDSDAGDNLAATAYIGKNATTTAIVDALNAANPPPNQAPTAFATYTSTAISEDQASQLENALAALSRLGTDLDSFGDFSTVLPVLDQSLSGFLSIADAVSEYLLDPVRVYLHTDTSPTSSELIAVLSDLDNAPDVGMNAVEGGLNALSELVFSFEQTIRETVTYAPTPDSLDAGSGVGWESGSLSGRRIESGPDLRS